MQVENAKEEIPSWFSSLGISGPTLPTQLSSSSHLCHYDLRFRNKTKFFSTDFHSVAPALTQFRELWSQRAGGVPWWPEAPR